MLDLRSAARAVAHDHDDFLGAVGRHDLLYDHRGVNNTEVFYDYFREVPVPSLQPGDIVVMYKLVAHRDERALALIEAVSAEVRFLPACFPDLNPIELMRSMVSALLLNPQPATTPVCSSP
jgi:transposase